MSKKKFPKQVQIIVTQNDIEKGKCRDPNKCMIKVAVARAIDIPHGYIKVDATGVSITRRNDYREKSDLPKRALENMLMFEEHPHDVRPFRFWLKFRLTTKVVKATQERRDQINKIRNEKYRKGIKPKAYDQQIRVRGIAVSKKFAERIGLA